MKGFTRVTLDDEIKADADGMPTFRKCFEHEILLSFYDDCGAYAFNEWWIEEGSVELNKWLLKNSKWSSIAE